ncbi:MAG: hypothetical protein K2J07_07115 [Muribaculaceae bacterium]|nr:hypothetical protein [Muribaculaceae bacterium]
MTAAAYEKAMSEEIMTPEHNQRGSQQVVIVKVEKEKSNSLGTVGFVLALLAIAGFILSFMGIIIIIAFIGSVVAVGTALLN